MPMYSIDKTLASDLLRPGRCIFSRTHGVLNVFETLNGDQPARLMARLETPYTY